MSGKAAFARLRSAEVKARRGALRAVYQASTDADGSAAAFAVPVSVGTAVERNRIRRRLRAILREVQRKRPEVLMKGDYLFKVAAPLDRMGHARLTVVVVKLLHELKARAV